MSSRPPPLDAFPIGRSKPVRPDPLDVQEIVAHQGFLRALARGLVGAGADADDLVQRTYLRVLERAPARPLHLRAWLRRVVFRLARDERRADERRLARDVAGSGAAGSETAPADALVQRMELHQRLVALVLALDPPYRSIVLLHHFDGLTVAKAAERLGVPLETARTRLRRALQTLRAQLDLELGGGAATLAALLPFLGVPLVGTTTKLTIAAASLLLFGGIVLWKLESGGPRGRPGTSAAAPSAAVAPEGAAAGATPVAAATADRAEIGRASGAAGEDAAIAPGCGALRIKTRWKEDDRAAAHTHVRFFGADADDGAYRSFATSRRAVTDEHGEVVLRDVKPGDVVVVAAGYDADPRGGVDTACARRVAIRAGETAEATLELPLGVVVSGEVVDGAQRPVEGAEIWLGDADSPFSDGAIVATADVHGAFHLDAVANGHYLAARAPGFAPSDSVAATFAMEKPADERRERAIRLVLGRRGATLRGRVADAAGRPISGALVVVDGQEPSSWLDGDGTIRSGPPPQATRSGADGAFEFAFLATGEELALALADGYAPALLELHVDPGAALERDFTLGEGGTLVGTVRDADGAAAAGVAVELWMSFGMRLFELGGQHARSAADGSFSFPRVASGDGWLSVDAGARGSRTQAFTAAAGAVRRCDVTLERALSLRGRVVDAGGVPLAGCRVDAQPIGPLNGSYPKEQTTDADGRFAMEGVQDIEWKLRVGDPAVPNFRALEREPVRPGGAEITLVLDALHRPNAHFVGRVVDAEGRPLGVALTSLFQVGGNTFETRPVAPASAPDAGRFDLGPLPPGRYSVGVSAVGYCERWLAAADLAANATVDLGDLALAKPATLVVRASRADGNAVEPADVRLRTAKGGNEVALVSAGGELRANRLDPGDYVLEVVGAGLALQRRAVTIGAGETKALEFPIETGVALRFVLRAADGALKGPVRWTASDANGEELEGTLEVAAGATTAELPLCLAVGDWTLEATAADAARGEASVRASRRAARGDALEVVLRRP